MDVLVTYDIDTRTRAGQRRLAAVAKVCESYGLRVQASVFECRLSRVGVENLVGALIDLIEPDVDSVNLYFLVGEVGAARRSLGRPPSVTVGGSWIA